MHRKSILGITGDQNQVKVTKGHEVQIFKKFIFELIINWTLYVKWSVEIQYPVRGLFLKKSKYVIFYTKNITNYCIFCIKHFS